MDFFQSVSFVTTVLMSGFEYFIKICAFFDRALPVCAVSAVLSKELHMKYEKHKETLNAGLPTTQVNKQC